jgi:hypothetical protein
MDAASAREPAAKVLEQHRGVLPQALLDRLDALAGSPGGARPRKGAAAAASSTGP